jgi:fumarate reductase subunit D
MSTSHIALAIALIGPADSWFHTSSPVDWVYLGSAALGGFVLLVQVVLSLFGADHGMDHDVGHDAGHETHDGSSGSWLSFRAIVAFLAFFGLGGMVGTSREMGALGSLGIALFSGTIAFLITRLVLMQFSKLRSSGTVDVNNAVGTEARVYLVIPAAKSGEGAVTVTIQGRTMQYRAITAGPELKTGALCKVSAVQANDTLVVVAL